MGLKSKKKLEGKFKHLTRDKRLKLEAKLHSGESVREIALYLGVHRSTIYREIKKGLYTHRDSEWIESTRYSCDLAEQRYRNLLKEKGSEYKIGNNIKLAELIELTIIQKKYSPAATLMYIKENYPDIYGGGLCIRTVYNYIDKGLFLTLTNKHLPVKRNKKRKYNKVRTQKRTQAGTSIEQRPKEIEMREDFGHWEMDSVVGKQGVSKSRLIVLTERKTRYQIIKKVSSGETIKVVEVMNQLEKDFGTLFKSVFKTITVDNGSEFADVCGIENSVIKNDKRIDLYYCHPSCSWERGTNEVNNKLIRRFIPKGTNFDKTSHKSIKEIQEWMNDYPRKILGWQSSRKLYNEELERAG